MLKQDFSHISTWVFDLDNTLYPPVTRLFDQIEQRMTAWVMRNLGLNQMRADALRESYWQAHGTTLAGLMAAHSIDPSDFLADVHDIDFSGLTRDHTLARQISALPGRRIIFTNADTLYATRVLERRGLSGLFDAIYGIEETGYQPKPGRPAFEAVLRLDGFAPEQAVMFEDDPRNLAEPHLMGMRTVLVTPTPSDDAPGNAHIHYQTTDLNSFFARLAEA
ncbi:pyrimidine 5'-nucleotidase [Xinfangfangia sp. D13-10-4-6]|uniref:pyrimidine 5'-nucleotidase n=1 Tax=Pseudogemmobacter hezensis TaxID=2737662 RepID=UPI00155573CA|nr:pyrimidine 5'-nucleotidase [Pseudogemmobacter hezensis]NPD16238.1 pyrimidine 5'-nucleotidase [Pseudogemmobacter hezensis]